MKLSNKEWSHIVEVAQMPRSHAKNISPLLEQYGFPVSTNHHIHKVFHTHNALCRLVEKYIEDATPKLSSCIAEIAEQCKTKPQKILRYIAKHQKTNTSLDEFEIATLDMLLQRLAYLCCIHSNDMACKLSINFSITDSNKLFYPMLETINILSIYPNLRKKKIALAKILSYRLGIMAEDIFQLFSLSFENEIPQSKQKYLQRFKDKSFIGICFALSKTHHSNFPLVG